MNLLSRLLSSAVAALRGRSGSTRTGGGKPANVRGRYDAAQTTDENRRHWANADGYSANAAHTPGVRQVLRNRSRYEAQNNGYCKGLLRTKRNDVVGTGPRLQVTLPPTFTTTDPDFFDHELTHDTPAGAASAVEAKWNDWCDRVGLAAKLRLAVLTGDRDGECFAVLVTNPALPATGPQLDVRLFEGDQVSTPDLGWSDPLAADGIRFDEWGNPVEYHLLRAHPGDLIGAGQQYDPVPARAVVHWYDPERPNQARGIPTLTPALGLYGQLRRFTLASLTAAETAAMIAGVMKSKLPPEYQPGLPPNDQVAATAQPNFERVEFERGALLTLPEGWDASSFDPAQPTASYGEFKREVLTEAGAAGNAPRNISTKSSAEYNYSSGKLDHIPYLGDVKITRDELRRLLLDRVFRAWLAEALVCPGYLPAGLPPIGAWAWQWQWDATPSIDPMVDANADDIGLKNGTRTLSDVLAERFGKDWEEHLRQKAREVTLARKLEREGRLAPGALYPLAPDEPAHAAAVAAPAGGGADEGADAATADAVSQAGGDVQNTALNGAQIASLLLIADAVVAKSYPADAAEAIVRASFPLMPAALVKQFIASLAKHDPPAQPEAAHAEPSTAA